MSPEERDILLGFDHDMAAVDDKDMNRAMDQLRRIRNNLIPAPSKNPNLAVGTEFKAWVNLICVRHRRRILERLVRNRMLRPVEAGAVVVSGSLPSADGRYSLYCAVIVKQVDEKTRAKVGINQLLRDVD